MDLNELYISRITARIEGFSGYLYTAKLVKTILINSIEKLKNLFEPTKGPAPKLIHISPLYTVCPISGKIRCIYSYAYCKGTGKLVKCHENPTRVELNGTYYFYVGSRSDVIKPVELVSGLMERGNTCIEFMSQKVCIEIERVDIQNAKILGEKIAHETLDQKGLKIKFSSPTMLRDPLRQKINYKSFIPSPINVFATPVYIMLYAKGVYTTRGFRTELLRLHRLFNETYSLYGGVRLKWVYYSNKPEPALIGFVNYRINEEYLEFLTRKLDVTGWLSEIFAYMLTLGVGTGRATGFGHVELRPLRGQDTES